MMSAALLYCIKFSMAIGIITIFYKLVLARLTFFNAIRYYFLFGILVALWSAGININSTSAGRHTTVVEWIQYIPSISTVASPYIQASTTPLATDPKQILMMGWIIGILVFACRLLIQCISFYYMKRKSIRIRTASLKIYHTADQVTPFSFMDAIYIHPHGLSDQDYRHIISHEWIHIAQRHSLDLLIAELICILNWYNPLAWVLKKSIRQNLEYLTDDLMLRGGINTKEYQYVLLKTLGHDEFRFTATFNAHSLKSRIIMMNTFKSQPWKKIHFLLILPIVLCMLFAFRSVHLDQFSSDQLKDQLESPIPSSPIDQWTNSLQENNPPNAHNNSTDTTPHPSSKSQRLPEGDQEYSLSRSFDTDDEIQRITIQGNTHSGDVANVYYKNGTILTFDLNNEAEREEFENKFGDKIPSVPPMPPMPSMPPMPPMPLMPSMSPMPPMPSMPPMAPMAPMPSMPPMPPMPSMPAMPPMPLMPFLEYDFPDDINEVNHVNDIITLTHKDGSTEVYDLKDPKQKQKFKEKFKSDKNKTIKE